MSSFNCVIFLSFSASFFSKFFTRFTNSLIFPKSNSLLLLFLSLIPLILFSYLFLFFPFNLSGELCLTFFTFFVFINLKIISPEDFSIKVGIFSIKLRSLSSSMFTFSLRRLSKSEQTSSMFWKREKYLLVICNCLKE